MKYKNRLILFLLLVFVIQYAQAQNPGSDHVYGFDPLLHNGRVYSFFPQPGTEGTQYMYSEFYTRGKITVRGTTFINLTLNYDIYNQQLILNYTNALGSNSLIELSKAWLESFEINGRHFEIFTAADTSTRICQVIGAGPYSIRYYYFKKLLPDTRASSQKYVFTDAEKDMFIYNGNELRKYKNNRSFVSVFKDTQQDMIRKYLRKQKIKVKRANDSKITELINFCNTLSVL